MTSLPRPTVRASRSSARESRAAFAPCGSDSWEGGHEPIRTRLPRGASRSGRAPDRRSKAPASSRHAGRRRWCSLPQPLESQLPQPTGRSGSRRRPASSVTSSPTRRSSGSTRMRMERGWWHGPTESRCMRPPLDKAPTAPSWRRPGVGARRWGTAARALRARPRQSPGGRQGHEPD
jgi:hypothetical protein